MKKAHVALPLLAASSLAGATTTTIATAWPDASILSIVAPPNDNHISAKDPEACQTEDLKSYFDVPLGPHSMVMAQLSYIWRVRDPVCTQFPESPRYQELCPPLDKDLLCGFAAAPEAADVLPAYSAYGSANSEWWQAHSASAVAVASRCPGNWWWTAVQLDERYRPGQAPEGWAMLNGTIMEAQCYAEAHATPSGEGVAPAATSGPQARPGSETAAGAVATGDATLPENDGLGRGETMGVWMVWGLAAAAVASVW